MDEPQVTRYGMLCMQVCVPKTYTDEQVLQFANDYEAVLKMTAEKATGHKLGTPASRWLIRKEGSPYLQGDPERAQCHERAGCCHIMLDC